MATDEQRTIRIGAIGVEGQEFTILKVAMNLLAAHGIEASLVEDGGASNDIVVVDADNETGKSYISKADGQIMLVLASQEIPATEASQFESKPIRVQSVSNSLRNLCDKVPETPRSKPSRAKAEPPAVVQALHKLTVGEARNLYELMLAARQQHQALRIEAAPIGACVVVPSNGVVGLLGDRKLLITNPGLAVGELNVTELSDVEAASALGGVETVEIGTLMWNMAIIGRHGELPPGHSVHTVVKLRAWPNFTRLGVGSNHINLSAMLTRQAMNLEQLAEVASAPLDTLAAFYNGALAIGLLVAGQAPAGGSESQSGSATEKRKGLFAKIANRLALMKGD